LTTREKKEKKQKKRVKRDGVGFTSTRLKFPTMDTSAEKTPAIVLCEHDEDI